MVSAGIAPRATVGRPAGSGSGRSAGAAPRFMPQHQQPGVLRRLAAAQQDQPAQDLDQDLVQQTERHQAAIMPQLPRRHQPQLKARAPSFEAIQPVDAPPSPQRPCKRPVRIMASMETIPITEAKARIAELADRVAREHDHFTITRNGRADVMLISVAEYESMQETLGILADQEAVADLRQSREDFAAGDTYTAEQVRAELEQRRRLGNR